MIVPCIASFFAEKRAYSYLAGSVQETLPVEKVADHIVQLGCKDMKISKNSLGSACRIMATKM